MAPSLTVENRAGQAIPFAGNTLVPITQTWRLNLPGINGGLIWNRPAAVVVQEKGQEERIVPVQDVTRQAVWLLGGLSFASLLLALLASRKHRRQPAGNRIADE